MLIDHLENGMPTTSDKFDYPTNLYDEKIATAQDARKLFILPAQ